MKLGETAFFDKCETCRKWRFYSSKRYITLPVGGTAKSQKLMCHLCTKVINNMIKSQKV